MNIAEAEQKRDPTSDFQLVEKLGEGSYGSVWKALDTTNGDIVAVKRVSLSKRVASEVTVMQKLQHPNIIQFKDFIEYGDECQIVMEYVDGLPLNEYVSNMGANMQGELRFALFHQILSAVLELHRRNICHRDIKLENIMITSSKQVKLIDFGFSKETLEPCTPCGSLHYAAPEVFDCKVYNGLKADMWSVGIILYALLFRRLPFTATSSDMVRDAIRYASIEFPTCVAGDAESLLLSLLQRDPTRRLSCSAAMIHPYCTKMLRQTPTSDKESLRQDKCSELEIGPHSAKDSDEFHEIFLSAAPLSCDSEAVRSDTA